MAVEFLMIFHEKQPRDFITPFLGKGVPGPKEGVVML